MNFTRPGSARTATDRVLCSVEWKSIPIYGSPENHEFDSKPEEKTDALFVWNVLVVGDANASERARIVEHEICALLRSSHTQHHS